MNIIYPLTFKQFFLTPYIFLHIVLYIFYRFCHIFWIMFQLILQTLSLCESVCNSRVTNQYDVESAKKISVAVTPILHYDLDM